MQFRNTTCILNEKIIIDSEFLKRQVEVDFYLPKNVSDPAQLNLLLINDGQNLAEMNFQSVLENLHSRKLIAPLLCVGIYASKERKMEYGVASQPDYLGRGAKAGLYTSFIVEELLPFIYKNYSILSFKEKAMMGFSLGALMALDIVWKHPDLFKKCGSFSGSFWWRSVDQDDPSYDDNKHRIMEQEIRKGVFHKGLKFFFQCGNKDETMDRNKNGIIDSIDDTTAVIDALVAKGYNRQNDVYYLEMPDGKHDLITWAKAIPQFLKWGWGK